MASAWPVTPLFLGLFALAGCGSSEPARSRGAGGAGGSDSSSSQSSSGAGGAVPAAPLELCINEFMPENDSTLADENGAFSDWIELHNPGSAPVDLAGWSLTDDPKEPKKSELGGGLSLPAKGFLLLWADNLPIVGPNHLDFKLDDMGGTVGLFAPDGRGSLVSYGAIDGDFSAARSPDCCATEGCFTFVFRGTPDETNVNIPPVTVSLLPAGSTWRYIDTNVPPAPAWTTAAFDDSALPSGPAPLGFGDPHIVTNVSFGPNAASKYITTWFRATFNVTGAASITSSNLKLLRDDGALVFLNGVEVLRSNLPINGVNQATLATAGIAPPDETTYFGVALDPSLFVEGSNVLTAEVHQATADSSDLGFDVEITASLPGSLE